MREVRREPDDVTVADLNPLVAAVLDGIRRGVVARTQEVIGFALERDGDVQVLSVRIREVEGPSRTDDVDESLDEIVPLPVDPPATTCPKCGDNRSTDLGMGDLMCSTCNAIWSTTTATKE